MFEGGDWFTTILATIIITLSIGLGGTALFRNLRGASEADDGELGRKERKEKMPNPESNSIISTAATIAISIVSLIAIGAAQALGVQDAFVNYGWIVGLVIAGLFFVSGIRIVRPTSRAIIERFGKFERVQGQGMTWIVPFVHKSYIVNITEQMTDAERQEIITKDNLNATVAAIIRFKVKDTDEDVKNSQYKVNDYRVQIIQLARTSLRNVIGTKDFKEVNNKRDAINEELKESIEKETAPWGIEIVSAELKEIEPPKDVQETMNRVLKAANEKQAAVDFATAKETEADGERRASVKKAEGEKAAALLKAQGKAGAIIVEAQAQKKSIELVNKAAQEYFVGNAITYRQMEVTENVLRDNSKFVIVDKDNPTSLILNTESGGGNVIPLGKSDDPTLRKVESNKRSPA